MPPTRNSLSSTNEEDVCTRPPNLYDNLSHSFPFCKLQVTYNLELLINQAATKTWGLQVPAYNMN